MIIQIDSREKGRAKRAQRHYFPENNATIKTLNVGDYVFNGKVVFEYKTINDFLNSINDESVFNEATNQAKEYTYHYVIIEGDLGFTLVYNFNHIKSIRRVWKTFENYDRASIEKFNGGIQRLRTFTEVIEKNTEEQCFDEMLQQATKCLEPKTYGGIVRPKLRTHNPVEYLLCGVHGVSSSKSEQIIKNLQIGSVNDLLNCFSDDFTSVPGIGVKTAKNIEKWIHKEVEK